MTAGFSQTGIVPRFIQSSHNLAVLCHIYTVTFYYEHTPEHTEIEDISLNQPLPPSSAQTTPASGLLTRGSHTEYIFKLGAYCLSTRKNGGIWALPRPKGTGILQGPPSKVEVRAFMERLAQIKTSIFNLCIGLD